MVVCHGNRRVAKEKGLKEFCPLHITAVSTLNSHLRSQPLPPRPPCQLCAFLSQLLMVPELQQMLKYMNYRRLSSYGQVAIHVGVKFSSGADVL